MLQDSKGIFWVVTLNGLNTFDTTNEKFTPFPADGPSYDRYSLSNIVEDTRGNLWFASNSGLKKLNPERTHFTTWVEDPTDEFSLKSNRIFSLALTDGGNLFITTSKGTQSVCLEQKTFGLLRHKAGNLNSLSLNEVTAIARTRAMTFGWELSVLA